MPVQITVPTYGDAGKMVARMVAHPIPTDFAGSIDPAIQQMGAAINVALGELLTMHEWQDLTVRASLSVIQDAPGQVEKALDLPDDFYRFIDQTQWGSASLLPALGPMSNQAWQAYVVRNFLNPLNLSWQMRGDQLWVLSPPPVAQNFEYMYMSKAQVIDADDPTLRKNIADKNGDRFLLDGFIITLFGRAKYLEWKGFDASAAMRDFLAVFNSRAGADKGATVLSLSRRFGFPLIDPVTSVPDTGYGV